MPHTKAALILMMAFTLPSAAEALGLGEIHVTSTLNEPLAADVDIVGATAEDLPEISASIADPEAFLRFGLDRPAFLSSAAFRIAINGNGQPVLSIRSTDAFTEPLISMLIDLRWHSGELIRQYTLLLDPAGSLSDTAVAEAARTGSEAGAYTAPAARELVRLVSQPPLKNTPSPTRTRPTLGGPAPAQTVKVAAGATLRGIASRLGSGGHSGLDRVMIAIYRGNPTAFEGNINRMRRGAVLTIPSFPEVSKISVADAEHEVRLQMESWRASPQWVNPARPEKLAVAASAPVSYEAISKEPVSARQESPSNASQSAIHAPDNNAVATEDVALDHRIRRLEIGLHELQGALVRDQGTLAAIQTRVALADSTRAASVVPPAAKSGHGLGASIVAVLVLAGGVCGLLFLWRSRRTVNPTVSPADAEASRGELEHPINLNFAVTDMGEPASTTTKTCAPDANAETTPLVAVRMGDLPEFSAPEHSAPDNMTPADESEADTAKIQYKLLDLDGVAHHIPMPSFLNDKGGFKERRTSLVDVLKVAVRREPNRRDLRIKLLETYYAAAASSRQGFLEVAQSLASERANISDVEWSKIAGMGRQIAADNDLFPPGTAQPDNKDFAICA